MATIKPIELLNAVPTAFASNHIYSGSRFEGNQESRGHRYPVDVVLQHVDFANYTLCGCLKTCGLTQHYPTLTTYFEGEIISEKFPFLTRKWEVEEDVDTKHWSKFPIFKNRFAKIYNTDNFDYSQLIGEDYIFMRWKELFLDSDYKIRDIQGASFAGFYYMCYQRGNSSIEGYYYHRETELYQSLTLDHVTERTTQTFQFV